MTNQAHNHGRSIWRQDDRMANRDLSGENFDHVSFVGANMSNTNFSFASFRFATFKNCNFEGSNFYGADLTGCCFGGSNLTGCDLENAKVSFSTYLPLSSLWFIRKKVVHNGPITATLEKLDVSIQDRLKAARVLKAAPQPAPAVEAPKPIEQTFREYDEIVRELDRVGAELAKNLAELLKKTADILVDRHELGKGN